MRTSGGILDLASGKCMALKEGLTLKDKCLVDGSLRDTRLQGGISDR